MTVTRSALDHACELVGRAVCEAAALARARQVMPAADGFLDLANAVGERVAAAFAALGTDSSGRPAGPVLLFLRVDPRPYPGAVGGRRWCTAAEAAVHLANDLLFRFGPYCGGPFDFDWRTPSGDLLPLLDGEHAAAVARLPAEPPDDPADPQPVIVTVPAAGAVELHAPDGPGADHTIRWQGQSVRLKGVQFRVVAYMWSRQSVGFDALAEHVNAHRLHETPTDEGFKTWVSRGNVALKPLGLPRRLRVDTVNRRIYWEEVPVTPAPGDGFTSETVAETVVTPA